MKVPMAGRFAQSLPDCRAEAMSAKRLRSDPEIASRYARWPFTSARKHAKQSTWSRSALTTPRYRKSAFRTRQPWQFCRICLD